MDDYDCPVKPEGREEENGGSLALSYCLYKNTAWNLLSCYTTILKCGCNKGFDIKDRTLKTRGLTLKADIYDIYC